jgi:hypothetical protein
MSRRWGRDPDWFRSLDADTQTSLIADYILETESQKDKEERKALYNKEQVRKMRERYG